MATSMVQQLELGLGMKNNWGGGFEVTTVEESKFVKMDKVWVRYWRPDITTGEHPRLAFNYFHMYKAADMFCCGAHLDEETGEIGAIPIYVPTILNENGKFWPDGIVIPDYIVDVVLSRMTDDDGNLVEVGLKTATSKWPWISSDDHIDFSNDSMRINVDMNLIRDLLF